MWVNSGAALCGGSSAMPWRREALRLQFHENARFKVDVTVDGTT